MRPRLTGRRRPRRLSRLPVRRAAAPLGAEGLDQQQPPAGFGLQALVLADGMMTSPSHTWIRTLARSEVSQNRIGGARDAGPVSPG